MMDDRFTQNVWYDVMTGDFHRFKRGSVNNDIMILDPITRTVIDRQPEDNFDPTDYEKVMDEAVKNPAKFAQDYLDLLSSGDLNELSQLTQKELRSVRFANRYSKIVEDMEEK